MIDSQVFLNEFSTTVVEAIDNEVGEQLLYRKQNISHYNLYGPPDLCYIVKEKNTSTTFKKKSVVIGSFHYVNGVNTSSIATIAAYLNSISG